MCLQTDSHARRPTDIPSLQPDGNILHLQPPQARGWSTERCHLVIVDETVNPAPTARGPVSVEKKVQSGPGTNNQNRLRSPCPDASLRLQDPLLHPLGLIRRAVSCPPTFGHPQFLIRTASPPNDTPLLFDFSPRGSPSR